MKSTVPILIAAVSIASAVAQESNTGVRVLVEVDPAGEFTIEGDVAAPSHQGWIRGRALQLGLGTMIDIDDPASPSLVTPDRIRLIKRFDVASADLARAFDQRRLLARVTVDFFLSSFDDPVPFRVVLTNATIEDFCIDLSPESPETAPTESLAFAYETITIEHTRYDGSGQAIEVGSTGFDATYGTADPALDSDGDGIDNLADPDDDNDGMPDAYELAHLLNPLFDDSGADPDRDGQDNGSEALSLTDPRDGQSRFGIRSITRDVASGELTVRVPIVPARRYVLQAAEGLSGWQDIDALVTAVDEVARGADFLITPPAGRAGAQLRVVLERAP